MKIVVTSNPADLTFLAPCQSISRIISFPAFNSDFTKEREVP